MDIEKHAEKVRPIFEKYQNQMDQGNNLSWAEFDEEIIRKLQRSSEVGTRNVKDHAGYQVVKKIIIHFYKNNNFTELCEEYAKTFPSGKFDMEGLGGSTPK
jgi:hypothetical protein